MNPTILVLNRVIGAVCRLVLYLTLTLSFVILSANVGLRYAAGTSLAWASELPELLFPWMIMAGVVLAAQHGSHIAVVILTQRLGAARRWVLTFSALTVVALYATLAWQAWPLMLIAADERSPMLNVPGSWSVGCLMVGFVMLSLVTLSQVPAILRGTPPDAAEDEQQGAAA